MRAFFSWPGERDKVKKKLPPQFLLPFFHCCPAQIHFYPLQCPATFYPFQLQKNGTNNMPNFTRFWLKSRPLLVAFFAAFKPKGQPKARGFFPTTIQRFIEICLQNRIDHISWGWRGCGSLDLGLVFWPLLLKNLGEKTISQERKKGKFLKKKFILLWLLQSRIFLCWNGDGRISILFRVCRRKPINLLRVEEESRRRLYENLKLQF